MQAHPSPSGTSTTSSSSTTTTTGTTAIPTTTTATTTTTTGSSFYSSPQSTSGFHLDSSSQERQGSKESQPPRSPLGPSDAVRASVSHLLNQAFTLPCSTGALAFAQLVQPSARFQLALDALLPVLDSSSSSEVEYLICHQSSDLAQRILVSFILYSLYTPHPVTINPFKSALLVAYTKEREKAVSIAKEGGVSPNEQFVWVLWKILKGDGNDIGPYSPSTLSRCPLPPKLRAINLVLDEELYNSISDIDDSTYFYFQNRSRRSASSDTDDSTTDTSYAPILRPRYTQGSTGSNSSGGVGGGGGTPDFTASPVVSAYRSHMNMNMNIINFEEDRQHERLIHAAKLLLAARDRVLTLSEQRALSPLIPQLASSNLITSLDLTPIIARNPTVAHPLLISLLTHPDPEANNPRPFLDVLPFLPPTLSTFDLYGRLLRDQTRVTVPGYSTVADLVLMEVLGRFVHEAVNWLDRAERDEREGNISDDRFAKGVQNLCRFYTSLIKLGIVDPSSDVDSAEMAHFSLRNARFEEANALYRVIATSRF